MGRKIKPTCLVCGKYLSKRSQRFCSEKCENAFLNYRNKLANILKRLYQLGATCEWLANKFNLTELEVREFILRASTVLNPAVRSSLMPEDAPQESNEELEQKRKLMSFAKFEKMTANKYIRPKKVFINGKEWVDFDSILKNESPNRTLKKLEG